MFPLFIVPVIATIAPYLACEFFDSPLLHGFFSAEEFFLLLAFSLPSGRIIWKVVITVAICGYSFYADSIEEFATAGVYLLIFFIAASIPKQKKFALPVFIIFSLLFFVADCENFFYSTFALKIADIWGLASFFWWGPVLFIDVPLLITALQYLFAGKYLYGDRRIELSHPLAITLVTISICLDIGFTCVQQRQGLMEYPIKEWFWQHFKQNVVGKNSYLQEDIKNAFPQWDGEMAVVTDYSRPTVMILVESFGINKSVDYDEALFSAYMNANPSFVGLYQRQSNHTQGAEWEDFGCLKGNVEMTPIPAIFKENGLQTWYVHGFSGGFYDRRANYAKFGFDYLLFRDDLVDKKLSTCNYGFVGICDSSMVAFLDSLLNEATPKFIYWTTLDSHPPYELATLQEKSTMCKTLALSDIDCTYFTLQENTAKQIAWLAKRHPEYKFIVRGDHRPMGALMDVDFTQAFYFKWVSMIALN